MGVGCVLGFWWAEKRVLVILLCFTLIFIDLDNCHGVENSIFVCVCFK